MPIIAGTSNLNQKAIAYDGDQMVRAYFDGELVWQKNLITNVNLGLLYNPYVIFDTRNILSPGWHIVNISEIGTLRTFSGDASTVGTKVKEVGAWRTQVNTNEYKLNLRESGYRNVGGSFSSYDWHIFLKWNSDTWRFGYCAASSGSTSLPTDWIAFSTTHGYSVRGIKDSTVLTHGQSGIYQGNDGKIYRTICIGSQEWLADNLAETKFRTGEIIPEITSDSAWAVQTGPALCALNNDWNNV